MRSITLCTLLSMALVSLPGCDRFEGLDLSTKPARATVGYTTAIHNDLISLPLPPAPIVVAVYKFRDQTGQYKSSGASTTFSTAVTQGATSMPNMALRKPTASPIVFDLKKTHEISTSTNVAAIWMMRGARA